MDNQQRDYPKSGYGAYTQDSDNNKRQTDTQSSSYFQSSSNNIPSKMSDYDSAKKPLVSGTDSRGFQYRSPEIGRVIPQGEIINRIVPYWEVSSFKKSF
jgi:hypothetical protein